MRRIVVTVAPGVEIKSQIGTEPRLPFKFDRFEDCPDADKHTPQPDGYVERSDWSERMLKTHTQHQCTTCGFWVVWKRRAKAKR